MATLRDDLVRAGRRLVETVEERTGREVVPRERLHLLESQGSENRLLRRELQNLGFELLNWAPGTPGAPGGNELRPEARRWAAKQSLVAWAEDPMAGQAVDLYISFVFGRGVPRPQANDPVVQDHLDKTWDDPANRRVLTSYERLIEKGIDLCLQSTVPFTIFDDGEDGMARVSMLVFDDLLDAIRHDELAADGRGDRFRVLYVKVLERRVRYRFEDGTRGPLPTDGDTQRDQVGQPMTAYYEVFGAFDEDDPVQAIQDEGLASPPADKLRRGKVYLLTVNKTSEMAFGVPRMRRLQSWFGAYNEMLVSFRDRMKAMASVYMKATVKGGQSDLDKLGHRALGRAQAFGASHEAEDGIARPAVPRGPGILGQNESLNYEPFKIDSGAGDVASAAPVMRSQITGPWPDGYLSGTSSAPMAGEQSLELPTLKWVEREQELWGSFLRAFGKASVDAGVRVGDISEWREPTQAELDQIAAADQTAEPCAIEINENGQVKRDLSFTVALPNPLKRAMLDIVSAASQTATAVDPNGTNPMLSRWLFATILAEAFDVEDPMKIVDEVLPRHAAMQPDPYTEQEMDPITGEPLPPLPEEGAVGPDGRRHPTGNPGGAPQKSPQPEDRKIKETPEPGSVDEAFANVEAITEAHMALLEAAAPSNGNGSHA